MMYQAQKQSATPCVLSLPKHSYCLLFLFSLYSLLLLLLLLLLLGSSRTSLDSTAIDTLLLGCT